VSGQGPLRSILEQRHLILGYINAIVRNLAVAEDLLQESLLVAMKQTFRDDQHAQAWIRVTARNLAYADLRKRARQPVSLAPETLELLESDWAALAEEDGGAHGRRLQALRTCCAALTASARTILDLRFHQGLDGSAIAERIGRPVNTVYVTLSRIYRRLADCVGQKLKAAP